MPVPRPEGVLWQLATQAAARTEKRVRALNVALEAGARVWVQASGRTWRVVRATVDYVEVVRPNASDTVAWDAAQPTVLLPAKPGGRPIHLVWQAPSRWRARWYADGWRTTVVDANGPTLACALASKAINDILESMEVSDE